jgi:hypothetical protein
MRSPARLRGTPTPNSMPKPKSSSAVANPEISRKPFSSVFDRSAAGRNETRVSNRRTKPLWVSNRTPPPA